MQCAVVFVIWGSPPRMRGKRVCAGIRCRASGITPAHAGKTPFSYLTLIAETRITPAHAGKTETCFSPSLLARDHPRACGENHLVTNQKQPKLGSPPRMRGKPGISLKATIAGGITPAHAGKTWGSGLIRFIAWDHPRACGENYKGRHRFGSF